MKEITNNPPPRRFAFVAASALLLLFLSVSITTYAQDENAPEAQMPESAERVNNVAGLLRVLNLTPQQRAQIGAIRRETNQQGRSLAIRLRQARRALDEALYADNPDDNLIEDRVREVGAAQTAVMRMRTFAELKIRLVLSPEQLNAFRRLQRQGRAGGGVGQRMNQTSPPDNSPDALPERLRNRMRRRQLEQQQQQQQPLSSNPQTPSPSPAPRERRRTRLRDRKP